MKFEIGDKVKQKFTSAQRIGTIVGIWDDDFYVENSKKESILFACKGEYKVKLDYNNSNESYLTFSEQELKKLQ